MSPEAGQAWFRIAMVLVLASAALLLFLEPGAAEFVVSGVTLVMGLLFCAVIVILVRTTKRRDE
jgi:cbb3-type cytochrome oxidase subunit 3